MRKKIVNPVTQPQTQVQKYFVSVHKRAQLAVRIADHNSTLPMYNRDTMHLFNEKLQRLQDMQRGAIPYEPLQYNVVELESRPQDATYKVYFFVNSDRYREAKVALQLALGLFHLPQALAVPGHPEHRRLSVNGISLYEAQQIINGNKDIFVRYEYDPNSREESGTVLTIPSQEILPEIQHIQQQELDDSIEEVQETVFSEETAAEKTKKEEFDTEKAEDDVQEEIVESQKDDITIALEDSDFEDFKS